MIEHVNVFLNVGTTKHSRWAAFLASFGAMSLITMGGALIVSLGVRSDAFRQLINCAGAVGFFITWFEMRKEPTP